MAGALNSTPTGLTALAIGSGHSVGGSDYPTGTAVYASVYSTVNTSAATVIASGISTQSITFTGFGPGDYVNVCSGATALPVLVGMSAYLSAANTVSVAFSNLSGATTTVPITTLLVHLVKVTP